jgi:ribonucleoside-diphosphate reductase alpha chain
MQIERNFTKSGLDAYAEVPFKAATSEIRNPDGTIVFKLENCQIPIGWSQVASDVIAQKYFRKAGVPSETVRIAEKGIPKFLWRSVPAEGAILEGETSAKQVFDRLAGAWTYWGWKGGYFTTEEDAQTYFDEMRYMLATQRAAPNSPQWLMGSTVQHKAIIMWTIKLASLLLQSRHTSIHSHMPVLSSQLRMIL